MAGIFVALLAARDLRLSRLRVHLSRPFVSGQNLAPIAVFVGSNQTLISQVFTREGLTQRGKHPHLHAKLKKNNIHASPSYQKAQSCTGVFQLKRVPSRFNFNNETRVHTYI